MSAMARKQTSKLRRIRVELIPPKIAASYGKCRVARCEKCPKLTQAISRVPVRAVNARKRSA
jgi:hypothetical protein